MAVHEMESRFSAFAMTVQGAESIDDLLLDTGQGQRADYLWRGRSVIAELKVLKGDPQDKIDSTFEDLSKRDDFPLILGSAPVAKVMAHLPDGAEQMRRLHQKVMRSVEAAFRDAKGQIANTKRLLGVDDALGLLVVLNPGIEALDPVNVGQFVSDLMLNRQSDVWSIDVVWLLSEAHFVGGGQPCIIIEGNRVERFPWADAFLPSLNTQWADFNNSPLLVSDATLLAGMPVQRKSERPTGPLTNEQRWRANYRANPYLSQLDDDAVRAFGNKAATDFMSYFLIDGPHPRGTMPPEHIAERSTHFLEEASMRGLDARGMGLEE